MAEHYNFTAEDVAEEVRKLAQERPDFIYQGAEDAECSYVTGAQGVGCIVGQAVQRLGVPEETLANLEEQHGGFGVDDLLGYLTGWDASRASRTPTTFWLSAVQDTQDQGTPWGRAVEIANANVFGAGEES